MTAPVSTASVTNQARDMERMKSASASRVAKMPVTIPAGVEVSMNGQELTMKGPKGKLTLDVHPLVKIEHADGLIKIVNNESGSYCRSGSGSKLKKSITGTTRANIANMVQGVTQFFEKKLLLVGVGYRAQMKGNVLNLTLGTSHPIDLAIPDGVTVETPSLTEIIIRGMDANSVGLFASQIKYCRFPKGNEPYKGKGIRYSDETIIRKETKKK